jgi:tRNA(adenine34) deaminase
MDDGFFMEKALAEARAAAAAGEVPVGAVLVDGQGRELARAANAVIRLRDPSAHAEILALRQGAQVMGNYRLPGTTLYVTLEPCAMCAGALIWARVERVRFAAFDLKAGALGSVLRLQAQPGFNHRLQAEGGLLAPAAAALLREFFERRRPGRQQTDKGRI